MVNKMLMLKNMYVTTEFKMYPKARSYQIIKIQDVFTLCHKIQRPKLHFATLNHKI